MKKLFIILAAMAFVIMAAFRFSGGKYSQVYSVGVLEKEESDEAVFVFLDENRNVVKDIKTAYPSAMFFDDSRVFYSTDDLNYTGINITDFKNDMNLSQVGGSLIAVNDDGSFFVQSETLQFVKDDKRVDYDCSVLFSCKDEQYLYVIDEGYALISFSLLDGSLKDVYYLPELAFINLCRIDGTVYLTDAIGYTQLKDGSRGLTYLYPDGIGEVTSVNRDLLFTWQNDEKVVYRVSFDSYSMKLELLLDESYYSNYNFEKLFEKYYQQGYEILNYFTFLFK